MNLMTEIAAKEEFSGLDAVSELLKDKDIETPPVLWHLSHYASAH